MARVLIVGGGCRGLALARELIAAGHAARITTRAEAGRAAIEGAGAECVIANPSAMGTVRAALDAVTIACWLLATASGSPADVAALHGELLEQWLIRVVDTTVRGVVYEAPVADGGAAAEQPAGARLARLICERNAIPLAVLDADPRDAAVWLTTSRDAVLGLLGA